MTKNGQTWIHRIPTFGFHQEIPGFSQGAEAVTQEPQTAAGADFFKLQLP
jgi:hypothetical protein